ncbi:MAG: PDZ domain-containing protein [Bacteroidales bacterium]|nr:PDZ domain-containing protein [Bacteroidales bacterium]
MFNLNNLEDKNMKKMIDFKRVVMMVIAVVVVMFVVVGCGDDDDNVVGDNNQTSDTKVSDAYKEYQSIHEEFYKYYLWSKESRIPDPATSTDEYYSKFSSPKEMVESFIVSKDKISWIMTREEYEEDNSTVYDSYDGISWRVYTTDDGSKKTYVIVTAVVENSPAEAAGLHRGCAITQINNTKLTSDNCSKLLDKDTKTVTYVETYLDENGKRVFAEEEHTTPSFSQRVLTWKSVGMKKSISTKVGNVGYLVLRYFMDDKDIASAFNDMKIWDVQDLILDLRIVNSNMNADQLASFVSYIVPENAVGKTFMTFKYGDYWKAQGKGEGKNVFTSKDNNLDLKRLFILYNGNMYLDNIVGGIRPYMKVIIIGEDPSTTKDHNYGSITKTTSNWTYRVVSSEWLDPDGDEYIAPTVDYVVEDIACTELGDPTEPLLAKALELINE